MNGRTTRRILASGLLIAALAGCSGSATSSPAASSDSGASQAAALPSSASPSSASPSAAEPSAAQPSAAEPSVAIPSLVLPSGAKDLEALLPDTMCGVKTVKLSMSGAQFVGAADAQFVATLQALGKTASDVAFAVASTPGGSGCVAGIFRIKGVDTGAFQAALLAQEQKSGTTYTQSTVGGKSVYVSDASTKQYVYFSGDAVIFAAAKDEKNVPGILQALP